MSDHSACQKRSTLSGIVCLLLAIAIVAGPETVMAGTIIATGRVKGLDETPKPFVSVSLVGPRRYSAMTNAEGAFRIRDVVPGKYEIRVRRGDFLSVFSRVVDQKGIIEDLIVKW